MVLAALTVALSVLWIPAPASTVESLTAGVLTGGATWEMAATLGIIAIGALALAVALRRGRIADVLAGASSAWAADWLGLPRVQHRLVVGPTLSLAAALARADDRVIDAGVRATGRIALLVSSLTARRLDISIDRAVTALARASMSAAHMSQLADDGIVDGAVEATGSGFGRAGHQSRRLQTGQTHHYFVIGAVGLAAIAALLVVGR